MAIDQEVLDTVTDKLRAAVEELWENRNANDIGPVIGAALCHMGASMYFYCEEDKSAAAVAVLEACTFGIEEARAYAMTDSLENSCKSLTLQ